jgi:thymidine kinase
LASKLFAVDVFGKTEELIRRLKRAHCQTKVEIFKPD